MFVCMYVYLYVCMYVCMYVIMHVCICGWFLWLLLLFCGGRVGWGGLFADIKKMFLY